MKTSNLYRVISGICVIELEGKEYQIRGISSYNKYLAEEYCERLVEEYSQSEDMLDEVKLRIWMIRNDYWSEDDDAKIKKYKTDLEDFKVKLFESGFKEKEKKAIKSAIKEAKGKLGDLVQKKHKFDFLTPEGSAFIAKNKYLMWLSLYYKDKPLFKGGLAKFLKNKFTLLDTLIIEYNKKILTIEEIREIARCDVWRKYWCANESETVFGRPAIDLTDEQLNLISWARVYDNIYQHPHCPSEEIIEDDDALDGFLIFDKRKRDKEKGISDVDKLLENDKIKNAQELFLFSDSVEGAKKIQNLNDESTRAKIRNREKMIESKGTVDNIDLPDVKGALRLQANQKATEIMRGMKG